MRDLTDQDLIEANLPERYWRVQLKEVPTTAPYRATIRDYLRALPAMREQGIGLFLFSREPGTGKTALANIVARRALHLGYTVWYTRAAELKDNVLANETVREDRSLRDHVRFVDFLVIDDLGKEYKGATGYTERLFEDVVRERAQWLRPTIITSNLEPGDIRVAFDSPYFSDVLKESTLIVPVPGEAGGGKSWRNGGQEALRAALAAARENGHG